jgi:Ulp1 family protease
MSLLLSSYRDADIYQRDLNLFKHGCWLNDSCIHHCFNVIEDEIENNSIFFMDPSVVSFLMLQADAEDESDFLSNNDIFIKECIVIPVNDNQSFDSISSHWSLMVYFLKYNLILHVDSSMPYNHKAAMKVSDRFFNLLKRFPV